MKGTDDEVFFIIQDLAERLTGHHTADVIKAFDAHEKASVFFPAYSDLIKFIQPRIDHRLKMDTIRKRNVPWFPDLPPKKRKEFEKISHVAGLTDEEPIEVRVAAVADWRERQRLQNEELAAQAERERLHPKVRTPEKIDPIDKSQTWHDPEALKASARRLNEYEISEGRKPKFNVRDA